MKENYYKEIGISFAAAFAVGIFSGGLGLVTFIAVALYLSRGSVPDTEMKKVVDSFDPVADVDEAITRKLTTGVY